MQRPDPSPFAALMTGPPGRLVVLFDASRSPNYGLALTFAAMGETFQTVELPPRGQIHAATFGPSGPQMAAAAELLGLVGGLKGTVLYKDGKRIPDALAMPYQVANCAAGAANADSADAYCSRVVRRPEHWEVDYTASRWVIPCTLLYYHLLNVTISHHHPASLEDQIQAEAVRVGCGWCPYFRAARLIPLDANTARTDLLVGKSGHDWGAIFSGDDELPQERPPQA